MTDQPGSFRTREFVFLICLATLILCLSLTSCDQNAKIAIVDLDSSSIDKSLKSPDRSSDAGADAAGMPSAGTGAAGMASNPLTANKYDASDSADCDRLIVAGDCDPTKEDNECPTAATMKCFVDFQKSAPTGYCAFYTPPRSGSGPCLTVVGVTDSCLPGHYCYNQVCRKLCLCNDDCLAGECCTEAIGGGFKLCADC